MLDTNVCLNIIHGRVFMKRQNLDVIFSVSKQLMLMLVFLSFWMFSWDKMVFFSMVSPFKWFSYFKKATRLALKIKWRPAKSYWPSFSQKPSPRVSCKHLKPEDQHPPQAQLLRAISHGRWMAHLPFPKQLGQLLRTVNYVQGQQMHLWINGEG